MAPASRSNSSICSDLSRNTASSRSAVSRDSPSSASLARSSSNVMTPRRRSPGSGRVCGLPAQDSRPTAPLPVPGRLDSPLATRDLWRASGIPAGVIEAPATVEQPDKRRGQEEYHEQADDAYANVGLLLTGMALPSGKPPYRRLQPNTGPSRRHGAH